MNETPTDTFLRDSTDQTITIDMNTEYLVRTYGKFLTKEALQTKDFYIEDPLSNTQFRSYRYVASLATAVSIQLPIQNLAKLYSKESGSNIWEKTLNIADLEEIDKAITLVKIATDSARVGDAPVNMARDITLTDGSQVNVEYVPYTEENTDRILADMNQHLEVVEQASGYKEVIQF